MRVLRVLGNPGITLSNKSLLGAGMKRSGDWGSVARALGLVIAAAALFTGTVVSASEGQKVAVTATVLKRATLEVVNQPAAVVVTQADLARGYVDVPLPAQLAILSNSPDGYLLEFTSHGDFMKQILVKGLTHDLQLNGSGGAVMQPATAGAGVTRASLSLGFRFLLSEATAEGTYPWPLRISVAPL